MNNFTNDKEEIVDELRKAQMEILGLNELDDNYEQYVSEILNRRLAKFMISNNSFSRVRRRTPKHIESER